ncbi:flagellar biosynthetic protein FliR [Arthrobacter sp. TPD3018]|jgi:flagellar biosynthetic protein FliR|uniref:flagellar biosynthetic protein FliR n=1 Tax=Bacteria TaxID=2 RepID=UPI000D50D278|nr:MULTISPECIES: flagellar biosynthetic protein FliR [Bacteria]PVE59248.1 flagellar biosynthetic protein FliR [Sphingomonas sp. TPD3009]PVE60769.1 flagellar biosynthetic protein FliR [Arthrobacter sp. TPD3018]PVE87447.1 flagellar biosynthetic protein FliR [Sphingomonas melonis]RTL16032.1 MAG: flagellar biosynthetic protein FliR [Sphingomonadaceae bacterium]
MLGFGLAIEPKLWALIFVMVRIGAAFILAPVFGAVAIPLPVRVGLTGAVGIFVLAVHPVAPPAQVFAVATFLSVFSEALVGAAIGFILQIAFAAPMVASEIIGGSMGIGFASSIDPQNGRSSPALGQFFTIMLTLLFLSVDGHLVLVQLLVKSYETMPPGSWISTDRLKDIAFFGGYAFLAGLLLALPVGFLLLCLNLVVGMVSRAAPSLNLFSVGLPASLAVGVVALAVAFPAMGDYMLVIIREGLAATDTLVNG